MLAGARAREAPLVLRRSTHLAWRGRWMRMLAHAFAHSPIPWCPDRRTQWASGPLPDVRFESRVFCFSHLLRVSSRVSFFQKYRKSDCISPSIVALDCISFSGESAT